VFGCVLFFKLAGDLAEGFTMIYESIILKSKQGVIAGFVVLFLTVSSVVVSILYNMSTGISNTDILKDVVLLLFLNEVDEDLYALVQKTNPSWLEETVNQTIGMKLNRRILVRRESRRIRETHRKTPKIEFNKDLIEGNDIDVERRSLEIFKDDIETDAVIESESGRQVMVSETEFRALQSDRVQLQNLSNERAGLSSRLHELETEQSKLKGEYVKFENLQTEHAKLKHEHEKLEMAHSQLETEQARLKDECAKLENLETVCVKLKNQNEKLEMAHSQVETEQAKLETECVKLKNQNEKLEMAHSKFEEELLELRKLLDPKGDEGQKK